MLEQGKRRKELRVVCDQIGTPTYTADLAKFLANLSMTKRYGIYHVTNEGEYVSWYDFAKEIFAQAVKLGEKEYADVKVIPVTTAEYGISKAARPFNSRLDRKRICEEGFQPLPVWKNAVSYTHLIGNDAAAMILGDNLFAGHGLKKRLLEAVKAAERGDGATIFGYYVDDPERFGIVEFDEKGKAVSIEEKPEHPKSNYCVTAVSYTHLYYEEDYYYGDD